MGNTFMTHQMFVGLGIAFALVGVAHIAYLSYVMWWQPNERNLREGVVKQR